MISVTMQNQTNLQRLFLLLEPGKVLTATWLESFGISRNLQRYYLDNGWLEAFGRGAYKKPGDIIDWYGALSSLQKQAHKKVHIGGLTALSLQGYSHYFRIEETTTLFSPRKETLPKWFTDYDWGTIIVHKKTNFLPDEIGIKKVEIKNCSVSLSTPERAIMECFFQAPESVDLVECYHLFEGLVNLKPRLLSKLLNGCDSIKVKRLFLYMADKANHQWNQFIKLDDLDIGQGSRTLVKGGVYQKKYLISVPKELTEL